MEAALKYKTAPGRSRLRSSFPLISKLIGSPLALFPDQDLFSNYLPELRMAKFLISFLFGLASTQAAAATPFKAYPEVIPGPGLPSLAELNLTSAQLYEQGPPDGGMCSALRVSHLDH